MTNVGGGLAGDEVWPGLLGGHGANRITKKCTRVADRAFPKVKVPPRQPGDFWTLSAKNMTAPGVYLYDFRDGKHCLYLGDYTTSEGLSLIPPESQIMIRHIYADTVPVLPDQLAGPQSVDATVRFIDSTHSIVDFECSINSGITLSSHDDCECHFRFADQASCEKALRCAVAPEMADTLWGVLLANRSRYVTIDDRLVVTTYDTFDDYLTTLK